MSVDIHAKGRAYLYEAYNDAYFKDPNTVGLKGLFTKSLDKILDKINKGQKIDDTNIEIFVIKIFAKHFGRKFDQKIEPAIKYLINKHQKLEKCLNKIKNKKFLSAEKKEEKKWDSKTELRDLTANASTPLSRSKSLPVMTKVRLLDIHKVGRDYLYDVYQEAYFKNPNLVGLKGVFTKALDKMLDKITKGEAIKKTDIEEFVGNIFKKYHYYDSEQQINPTFQYLWNKLEYVDKAGKTELENCLNKLKGKKFLSSQAKKGKNRDFKRFALKKVPITCNSFLSKL
jgi:hypothetical protein